ncbi:hypothetical protein CK203_032066 [Vitis vinifera]|uniref:Retrotransposon gag domain-containing protein n=1 Tax=Vitis vinifera TaxID=29760 RepID=A0A438FN29_VITVI|nr:hypothetical protein CK203_032066 [Vitis vinifera]
MANKTIGGCVRTPCPDAFLQGEDDNFEWRLAIERRQLASERQLKALLQETERLREENAVLRIQASTSGPPRRQRSRGQVANSRPQQEPESIYPGTTGAIPGACNVRPHEPRTPMPRAPRPQEPGRSRPPMATTWAPRPDPMVQNVHPHRDPVVTPVMRNVHSHPAEQPTGRNIPNGPPIGSISKRLDDMLSTPFCSHIINYEPPRGFLVPKFSTYDGTNDPFDHIMHYRQLMTLDIGNDALLCKVFPASLQGQALSWFHRLPPNSVGNFRDLSEAFVGQYLCSARHKQNISTLQNIKMQDNESLREFVKRFGQAVLQVEACSMDAVLQIFNEASVQALHFSNHWLKSLLQRWMTYSDEPTNIQCSKMTYVQPPSKFWLPDGHLEGLSDFKWPRPIGTDPSTRDRKEMCLPQGSWPYNRDMPIFPVSGRKTHKSRAFEAIPPIR